MSSCAASRLQGRFAATPEQTLARHVVGPGLLLARRQCHFFLAVTLRQLLHAVVVTARLQPALAGVLGLRLQAPDLVALLTDHVIEAGEEIAGRLQPRQVETVIIGTGFSGLLAAIRLQKNRCNDFVLLERNAELGGTWQVNSYPGAEVDVPTSLYCISFIPYPFRKSFAPQSELLSYTNHIIQTKGQLTALKVHLHKWGYVEIYTMCMLLIIG